MSLDATSRAFADEVARVRASKRHAVAMTPLASVPLDVSKQDRKRRPFVVTRSPGQVMRYPKRPAIYDR